VRRKYKEMMDYYRAHEAQIIKAQAFWRGKLARTKYLELSTAPSLAPLEWKRERECMCVFVCVCLCVSV
jgi:hypothetical protein